MKIWFDILTPKQFLFSEPFIKKLRTKHTVLCTSRKYRQVTGITDLGQTNLVYLGKHGGSERFDKLVASLDRSKLLAKQIRKFKPDLAVSFSSPEASRVAFGLGIKHITFSDSPHATKVMKLCLPFVDKLLIPWIIPKSDFKDFGINPKNIIHYKTIDAAVITKRRSIQKDNHIRKEQKTILIRPEEEEAAYVSKQSGLIDIIEKIIKNFPDSKKLVLTRYKNQTNFFKKKFPTDIQIISKVVDGKKMLLNSDVFIGSGGTMTAESALLGIPTISYNAVPNRIEKYLVTKKLVSRCMTPNKITKEIERIFSYSANVKLRHEEKVKRFVRTMEDPYPTLLTTIKSILK